MSTDLLSIPNILDTLDHCDDDGRFNFIDLEHPYVSLADCRLNLFRDDEGRWAIVSEVLGYHNRGAGWAVALEIRYFGNSLLPLEDEAESYNYYLVLPLDPDSFNDTIEIEALLPEAAIWKVRGVDLPLSHDKIDYDAEGIQLGEMEPGEISGQDVLRLMAVLHRSLFRATEEELYKGIPTTLRKILVLDEWHHKAFRQSRSVFERPDLLQRFDLSNPSVAEMARQSLQSTKQQNAIDWESRPSSYETWQQIAEVLATGDIGRYRPTLPPNTHWKNWPEGGTM